MIAINVSHKYKQNLKIFKAAREKLCADFSAATLQTRREWHDIFKMMMGDLRKRNSTWQGCNSELRGRVFLRRAKTERGRQTEPAEGETLKGLLEAEKAKLEIGRYSDGSGLSTYKSSMKDKSRKITYLATIIKGYTHTKM